jgi:hypothetical protein
MRFLPILIAALVFIGCDKKADPKLATPKAAARTLFQAMYDNDLAVAKACVIEGPGQMEFTEGMTKMMASMRGAMEAAYKQFGDEFNKLAGGSLDTMHIDPKQIEEGSETINGDSATVALQNGKTTLQLIRKDNAWKVDMVQTFTQKTQAPDQQTLRLTTVMFAALARAGDQTRAEIEAKKYSTGREAVQGMLTNMKNALQEEKNRAIRELSPR